MSETTIYQVAAVIFGFGVIYGMFNNRIKNLEKQFSEHKDTIERLARVEEKLNLLLEHFIK